MCDFNMLSMGLPTMFLLYKGVATLSPLHLHVMSSHLNMFCEKTCYSLDSWAQGLRVSLKRTAYPCEFSEHWLENLKTKNSSMATPAFNATSSECTFALPTTSPASAVGYLVDRLTHPSWGDMGPANPLPDCWRRSAPSGTVFNHLSFCLFPESQPIL